MGRRGLWLFGRIRDNERAANKNAVDVRNSTPTSTAFLDAALGRACGRRLRSRSWLTSHRRDCHEGTNTRRGLERVLLSLMNEHTDEGPGRRARVGFASHRTPLFGEPAPRTSGAGGSWAGPRRGLYAGSSVERGQLLAGGGCASEPTAGRLLRFKRWHFVSR